MNSVTMVRAFSRNRSMTLKAPQNLAETLEDQPCMADAGHRAEAKDHLLIDVEHGNQKQQRPQQRRAVVLPGLSVGAEGAGVIVADHDDQTGAEDREKGLESVLPIRARAVIAVMDGAQRAADVTDMRLVEDSAVARFGWIEVRGHDSPLFSWRQVVAEAFASSLLASVRSGSLEFLVRPPADFCARRRVYSDRHSWGFSVMPRSEAQRRAAPPRRASGTDSHLPALSRSR